MTTPIAFFVFAVVCVLIGLSKGGLGGTLGGLATPLMALVLPVDQVIGLILPVLIFADIFAVRTHWQRWDWRQIILLLPGAVAGVTIGTLFITNAPTSLLRIVLGVIILLFAVYKLFEGRIYRTIAYQPTDWHGRFAGTVAGFSSALAHTGGPPISIYLLLQDLPPRRFLGTSALFFGLLNLIKVPYYFYAELFDFESFRRVLWLLPLLPLGVWAGKTWAERISKRIFERVILFLLVVTALMLVFT